MTRAAIALAALTLIRLWVAATAPLAPDEAYYWIWSRALAPGYLDHPPMVALWIRIGTALCGDTPLGIRLLGPLSGALGSWLLADAANRLLPGRGAGVLAATLFNATLLMGVGTVIMTPDTPLILFWTATLWALARIAVGGGGAWWLAAGGFAGLALLSKYTAVFLWAGTGLWLLAVPAIRPWLRRPAPWAGMLLGGALFLPVLAWNAAHGWAGFLRQGGRISDWRPERSVQFLAELIGGQAGLVTPGIWLLCLTGTGWAVARAVRQREAGPALLALLTVPPMLMFLQHAFHDRVQGNWPAIIYPAAVIAAAGLTGRTWQRLTGPSVVLGLAVTALAYAQATVQALPIPPRLDPVALRLAGWDEMARQVEAMRRDTGAAFVAVEQYALAAELAYTLPSGVAVLGVEPRWALTSLPAAGALAGRRGLLLRDARIDAPPDRAVWGEALAIGVVDRTAGGAVLERYRVFRVRALDAGERSAVLLPRPRP
ncbi:MAG: glycosyltransferase family 39 protein [Acetobacteraceae bacterium]